MEDYGEKEQTKVFLPEDWVESSPLSFHRTAEVQGGEGDLLCCSHLLQVGSSSLPVPS